MGSAGQVLHRNGDPLAVIPEPPIDRILVGQEAWLEALGDEHREVRMNPEHFGYRTVAPRWRIRRRRILDHLFYLVVGGACEGSVGDRPVRLEPGDFLWVAPGVPHEFWSPPGLPPMTFYYLEFRVLEGDKHVRLAEDMILSEGAWELRGHLEQAVDEQQTALPHRPRRMRGFLTLLCVGVFRLGSGRRQEGPTLNGAQRRRLSRFARERVARRPTPADLASEVRLSPDYFARVFRRTYGVAPRTWLLRERLRAAALRLVESDSSVTEIARGLGYGDVYLFSRQFKRVHGCSPRAYRAKH